MTNEIQVIEENEIAVAFQTFTAKELFERVKEQATSIVFDLSNPKERIALKSHVYKIRQSKTAFDNHGSDLKKQYTEVTSKIDAERKVFKTECDKLIEELLAPLVEIELAEKKRTEDIKARIQAIKDFLDPTFLDNSNQIKANIANLKAIEIDESFQELQSQAKLAKYETLEELEKTLVYRINLEKEEAEAIRIANEEIEAERIKKEAEEKQRQIERDERIARDAAEKAQREAEEKARLEVERFEREKREQAEKVAREKQEAEQRESQLKLQKEQAELREAQLKQKAIDDAKQAEIDKQNAIEAERLRIESEQKAQAEAAEKAEIARQENKKLRDKVLLESVESLINETGIDEDQAKKVIKAIFEKKVLNISIKF